MPRFLHLHFNGTEFLLPPPCGRYDIEEHATTILTNVTNGNSRIFCDISFYLSLRCKYPYSNISICKISCWHKMYIHAFQISYQVHHIADGKQSLVIDSPTVTLKSGSSFVNQNIQITSDDCELSIQCKIENILAGEYITEAHQEGMMERLIFTTNKRTIIFGVQRHECFDRMLVPLLVNASRKIVAFGGSCYKDRRLKVAYFTESMNWTLIGDFVLLRNLLGGGRALFAESHHILQFILIDASEEIFRLVLSFISFDLKT